MNKKTVKFKCMGARLLDLCPNEPVGRQAFTYGKHQISGGRLACAEHGGLADQQCVIDAFVNYEEEFTSTPRLHVLLLKKPAEEDFIFEKRGPFYFAEHEGVVRFHSYAKPDRGFGGANFHIKMKDGTEEDHKGPWSSSAGSMNAAGFTPCVDVSIAYLNDHWRPETAHLHGLEVFEKGHTFSAGAITLELAFQAIRFCCQGVSLMWHGDYVIPVKMGYRRIIGERPEIRAGFSSLDELSGEQRAVVG